MLGVVSLPHAARTRRKTATAIEATFAYVVTDCLILDCIFRHYRARTLGTSIVPLASSSGAAERSDKVSIYGKPSASTEVM